MEAFKLFYDLETSTDSSDWDQRVGAAIEVLKQPLIGTQSIQNARTLVKEVDLLVERVQSETSNSKTLELCGTLTTRAAWFYLYEGQFFECMSMLQQSVLLAPKISETQEWDAINRTLRLRQLDGQFCQVIDKTKDEADQVLPYWASHSFINLIQLDYVPNQLAGWGTFYFHHDSLPLIRELSTGGNHREKLLLFIASRAQPSIKFDRKVQSPKNIKRQSLLVTESPQDLLKLLTVAETLERMEQTVGYSAQHRLLVQYDRSVKSLWDVESYVLALAAGAAACKRQGWDVAHQHFLGKFEQVSLGLTLGRSKDLFGMMQELENESATPSGSIPSAIRGVSWTWFRSKVWEAVSHEEFASKARSEMHQLLEKAIMENVKNVGGAVQKVAQLGAQIEGLMPETVRDRLAASYESDQLQSAEQISSHIQKEFGEDHRTLFKGLYLTPFATGSLGQVHRGILPDGKACVVKFLYPDLEKTIDKDFSELKKYLWFIKTLLPHSKADQSLAEWKRLIKLECDYVQEADFQEFAHQVLDSYPDLNAPAIHRKFCSKTVLTQDLVEGESIFKIIESGSQETRNLAGTLIVKSIVVLLRAGLFRFDIHPGNYQLEGQTLHCLDFGGSVWTKGHSHNFLDIIDAIKNNDQDLFEQELLKSKFYDDISLIRTNKSFERCRDTLLRPFVKDEPFRFTKDFAAEVFRSHTQQEAKATRGRLPASQEQVDIRFYWSLYSLLGQLRAEANWYQLILES